MQSYGEANPAAAGGYNFPGIFVDKQGFFVFNIEDRITR